MKLYTGTGDEGITSLMNGVRISKSEERIELLGTIDELSSYIGLAKVVLKEEQKQELSSIQKMLITIMAGVADTGNKDFQVTEEQITLIEKQIDSIENKFPRQKEFILYGECEESARLDVARSVARRAERCFKRVELRYDVDLRAMKYMNRLSDYLYILARYEDYQMRKNA